MACRVQPWKCPLPCGTLCLKSADRATNPGHLAPWHKASLWERKPPRLSEFHVLSAPSDMCRGVPHYRCILTKYVYIFQGIYLDLTGCTYVATALRMPELGNRHISIYTCSIYLASSWRDAVYVTGVADNKCWNQPHGNGVTVHSTWRQTPHGVIYLSQAALQIWREFKDRSRKAAEAGESQRRSESTSRRLEQLQGYGLNMAAKVRGVGVVMAPAPLRR